MGFSRQEYWSGLPFPSLGDLPDPGIKPRSPVLQADSLPTELQGSPHWPRCNLFRKNWSWSWKLPYILGNISAMTDNSWIPGIHRTGLKYSFGGIMLAINNKYKNYSSFCLSVLSTVGKRSKSWSFCPQWSDNLERQIKHISKRLVTESICERLKYTSTTNQN